MLNGNVRILYGTPPPTVAARLIESVPSNHETGVDPNGDIILRFDRAMNPETFKYISLDGCPDFFVEATDDNMTAVIRLNRPLMTSRRHIVIIPSNVTCIYEIPIGEAAFTFTTGRSARNTPIGIENVILFNTQQDGEMTEAQNLIEITTGLATIELTLYNNESDVESVVLLFAVYDENGALVSVQIQRDMDIPQDAGTITVSQEFAVQPGNVDRYFMKIFIWESAVKLNPVAGEAIIIDSDGIEY